MPPKVRKLRSGKTIILKSIHLVNGNLLVRTRSTADRTIPQWTEVAPGDPLYKRWLPVASTEPDPRGSS